MAKTLVDPSHGNLCQAVESALVDARRASVLEAQLRILARQRRQLRLELEATKDVHAKHRAAWQVRRSVLSLLAVCMWVCMGWPLQMCMCECVCVWRVLRLGWVFAQSWLVGLAEQHCAKIRGYHALSSAMCRHGLWR